MKTWQEIYKKYKDTESFKEFEDEYYNQWGIADLSERTIRDVFGHIVCFAETKGWCIEMLVNINFHWTVIGYNSKNPIRDRFFNEKVLDNCEKAMNYGAKTFFEVVQ